MSSTRGWVLTLRKTGKTRHFATLEAARPVHRQAAARYGTRWISLDRYPPTPDFKAGLG